MSTRIAVVAVLAAVMLCATVSSAFAWSYGQSWIIPLDPNKSQNGNAGLQGSNWNQVAEGSAPGGSYWWSSNQDAVRRARWFFDASVHGGDAPAAAEKFKVEIWVAPAHANVWQPIEVSFDGLNDEEATNNPNIPWAGQFGTNHQWIGVSQANQGAWVSAGPGPQTDGGGDFVWAKGGSYFWVKTFPWYDGSSEYGFSAIRITVVPEPASLLALGGGLLSMAGLVIRRRS